jgi:hypothetical protein
MKALIAVLILIYPLSSQSQKDSAHSACAESRERLAVSLDRSQHLIEQPAPEKSLIYFIQDTDQLAVFPYPIVKVGIDGKLAGANSGSSYFAVTVEPGWHDLCTVAQSPFTASDSEFDHLFAQPGKVYSFRVRLFLADSAVEYSSLAPLNSDEAADLIASYPRATAVVQRPDDFVPLVGRSTLASVAIQSSPGSQLALNGKPEKAARSHSGKDPAPHESHNAAVPPKEPRDKSDHEKETQAAHPTQ